MDKVIINDSHHSVGRKVVVNVLKPLATILIILSKCYDKFIKSPILKSKLGYCGNHVVFRWNEWHQPWGNVYLEDYTQLNQSTIISNGGRLIIKRGSGAAEGLVVITNNHKKIAGDWIRHEMDSLKYDFEKDIIVEEDVWIGANVTLLGEAYIGRGAVIGAGSVIRCKIPPYAIVTGNPAKVVGFAFTPEETVEHEKMIYTEEERLPLSTLQKNYEKYFLNRIKDIKDFSKL